MRTVLIFCAFAGEVAAAPFPEFDGLIEPNKSAEIRTPVDGIVDSIAVDRSDVVKRGEVLVRLRADVEEAAHAVASANAKFNVRKQERATELFGEKAISLSDKEQADGEAELSKLQMRHAEETLDLRVIRSPFDGIIAERHLSPGESVKDKTILKVVQINPLRVEVVVPAAWYGQIRTGMRAEVTTEISALGALAASVTIVDKVIDAASGTFGVRLKIPNADHKVPSGLRCKVRFLGASAR